MSARSEALNILYRIMHDDGYASLIMRESKIKKEEMASVTNIVYGVLRNYTYLEYQWRKYAKRTKLKTALAIDIAVFEMFFTNALFKDLVDICKNAIVILSISSVKINRHWQFNDISAYEWYLFHH